MIDAYLLMRLNSIKIVKNDIVNCGRSERCPLPLNHWDIDRQKSCFYCKAEFSLISTGCPCYAGYCKDRLIEVLDKWIKLAGG